MHNPQEYLKIAQDRADLQNCTPVNHYSTPRGMAHDNAVQDRAVLPQKLPKSRIIESLYIAEVRGLQTRDDVRKRTSTAQEYSNTWILKYPKGETLT